MTTTKNQKTLPKAPFFETSVKNYIYGDAVFEAISGFPNE